MGKCSERGGINEVCDVIYPLKALEYVGVSQDCDSARQWVNKLILGDNQFVLNSLKNDLLRKEVENQGGIKLIYIDPPFDVGANFLIDIELGKQDERKSKNTFQEVAYRDVWGKGEDSFIAMIYPRLLQMRDLLAEDGSIYVHCDYRLSGKLRQVLDEIFGNDNLINEIIWFYKTGGIPEKLGFGKKHDTIFYYAKNAQRTIWNPQKEKSYLKHKYGFSNIEIFEDEIGMYTLVNCRDVWDIPALRGNQPEKVNYPTQKPESLLERIIMASSNSGDIVCDFFCGSGTTLAVAERLGRKWIGSDIGKLAIHTTRKRMIDVLKDSKIAGKNCNAFGIFSFGDDDDQNCVNDLKKSHTKKLNCNAPCIEIRQHVKGNSIAIELINFSVLNDADLAEVKESLKNGKSRVVVIDGNIVKVSKDRSGMIKQEVLTTKWIDLVDYWAVDFDFDTSTDYVFKNEWQSFRTRKDRELELISIFNEGKTRAGKIAIKVIDVFGNDAMSVFEVDK